MATRRVARRRRVATPKGLIAGLVGGLAASWAMNQFQAALSRVMSDGESPRQADQDEDATQQLAQAIATNTIDRRLTKQEAKVAGPVVHYAYGTLMGGLYGAVAEQFDGVTPVGGPAYGALLWAAGDEIAVPLLGLSRSSAEFPLRTHVQALAAHVVYGLTADLVRRGVRAALSSESG